jgi:hypothetical protein
MRNDLLPERPLVALFVNQTPNFDVKNSRHNRRYSPANFLGKFNQAIFGRFDVR